ncbi:MAG: hypothetical protein HFJ36_04100 [Clostridia bacterium]|nr:hypothetical protein [Clostridia bacterium]
MKKIGFIGAYDKTDMILYVAKILTMLEKKVLIMDSTINQKARYVVPAISPAMKYVTDFEDIDIAVGFSSIEDMKNYLGLEEQQELEYDFIFVDTDNQKGFSNFFLENSQKNYFVTSFDNYSLKKGLEILSGIQEVMSLTKVLFSKDMIKEEDEYLNFLSLGHKVIWNEYRIYFPIENGDLNVIYENQRLSKIKFKKLSVQYKDGLVCLAQEILGDVSEANIRKTIKIIEKGA